MLTSLYISNYALISELNIKFSSGLTVITGETGAGKSIILGALSLILGQRADSKTIKADAEKCVIEAEFDITAYTHLDSFFVENELDNLKSNCLIRRELTNTGKSRAFINDTPVSLNVLRDLTIKLIDIHSQHENLLLSTENYQLNVVDSVANNVSELVAYQACFEQWKNLQNELKKLQHLASRQSSDLDYVQFQFNQLTETKLVENEQEELEAERETLSHAEDIKLELVKAGLLLEDEQSALPLLKEAISSIAKIKSFGSKNEDWYERLQSSYIELKDIASEINSYAEKIEFDPDRLEFIDNRLSELYTLQKKYKVSTLTELIEIRDNLGKQLARIESFDDDINELTARLENALNELITSADKLSESRKNARQYITGFLTDQLIRLGMPNIRFEVEITKNEEFTESGNDIVQFLFSANKNRDLQPVQLIASGGEISRIMLALKSMIADKSDLPSIIFDEIDTGVSGEIAHRMGEIMQSMSSDMQVITITHLPQIAAKGTSHFRVFKDDNGQRTETQIQELTGEDRTLELAQMLSGKDVTKAAMQNARELLKGVDTPKINTLF